ncbi:MAG: adhesin transport system membrane fusion protein [Oleiphilaceae bacterium]|jgi:adhesin transport system membrane fusion protein
MHSFIQQTYAGYQLPSIRSRLLLWLVCLFIVSIIIWSAYAEVDELVRGEGKVIPSKRLQIVQNLEGGIVSALHVSEGSVVEKGQVLLKIDDTLFESNYQENRDKILALNVKAARLRAEISGAQKIDYSPSFKESGLELIKEQGLLFVGRRAQLIGSQNVIDQQILQKEQALARANFKYEQAINEQALTHTELDILKPLYEEGVVSRVELLRVEKIVLKASGDAAESKFRMPQIEAEVLELINKRAQLLIGFRSEAQKELSDVLTEISRLAHSSDALEDRVNRTQVRSPVNGTIKQLMVNTIGGVVQPAMDIVSIVPIEDALLIETKIKPADIARLYPGQRAMVKFTAYDFTIYGGLEAEVVQISADSIVNKKGESFYLVRVKTNTNDLGKDGAVLPIFPGMIAQVDILTGKKTILNYILKPILKAKQVALTEV